jgi:hypothetical protein
MSYQLVKINLFTGIAYLLRAENDLLTGLAYLYYLVMSRECFTHKNRWYST